MRKQLSEDDIKRIFSIRKQKKPKILQVKIVKPIIMNPKKIDKTIRKLATAIKKMEHWPIKSIQPFLIGASRRLLPK